MHFPNRTQVSLMSVLSRLTGQLQHIAAPPTVSRCISSRWNWIVTPGLNTPHRELVSLQRVYLWLFSLVVNFRLLTDTGTLPDSSLNRPAACTSTYTQGRLHHEAGRVRWITLTHTKWEGSLSEVSPTGHTPLTCCEQHSPPEHFSDLIEIIHVLLLEHCHARCLHWRSLSPWYAPLRRCSTSPTLLIQRRVLADVRLEWCKGLLTCSSLLCCIPSL